MDTRLCLLLPPLHPIVPKECLLGWGRPHSLRGPSSSVWSAGVVLQRVQLLSSRDDEWFNPLLALPSLLLSRCGGCGGQAGELGAGSFGQGCAGGAGSAGSAGSRVLATQGAECPSVTQLGAPGGRMDAWSSVPLGPVSTGPGASSGGMAAASPSRATAQPGWPGHAGHPSFFTPFLPDVADGGSQASCQRMGGFPVVSRRQGCLLTPGSHGCQCSTWLHSLSPWHYRQGILCQVLGSHQDLSLSCTSQRERRWRPGTRWHPWLPAPPASLLHLWLGWLRKILGFLQCEGTGKPPNPLLRSLGTTPALTRSRETPSHPGTTHASTPKPSWDAECRI